MTNITKQCLIIASVVAVCLSLFLLLWCLRDSAPVISLDEPELPTFTELYCNYQEEVVINNINPLHYPLSGCEKSGDCYPTHEYEDSQGLFYYVIEPQNSFTEWEADACPTMPAKGEGEEIITSTHPQNIQ